VPVAEQRRVKPLAAGATDVGRHREHNEDRFLIATDHRLVAVADGMGGHSAGEVAAQLALDALVQEFVTYADEAPAATIPRLVRAVTAANERVYSGAQNGLGKPGMGTTLVVGTFARDVAVIAHVGDSRAYLLRQGKLSRITCDHSLVEQTMKANGALSPEALAEIPTNVILRAIGVRPLVDVEINVVEMARGDRLLFCSDGLTGMVADGALQAILGAATERPVAANELIRSANAAGGADNITAIIVDFE
jgi:serine/threonine protein phosphatase PrpC